VEDADAVVDAERAQRLAQVVVRRAGGDDAQPRAG
jgi:hypothetical protein